MTAKPYTSGELMTIAIEGRRLDPERALATYGDPNNWAHVHADGRHWWAWAGPVIVGYELAELVAKRATLKP